MPMKVPQPLLAPSTLDGGVRQDARRHAVHSMLWSVSDVPSGLCVRIGESASRHRRDARHAHAVPPATAGTPHRA